MDHFMKNNFMMNKVGLNIRGMHSNISNNIYHELTQALKLQILKGSV
jgi:hypothetical protein